jgi:diacylglycerol kinase
MFKRYLNQRAKAFQYAFKGIYSMFKTEAHAKIHLVATICVIACGIIFKIERWEWCAVLICIGGVLMAEAFNTAIEKLADAITKERHPLIGAAKDIAAGAVLLLVIASIATGLIVFIPHIVH